MRVSKLSFNNEVIEQWYTADPKEAKKVAAMFLKHPKPLYGLDFETAKHEDFIEYDQPKGKTGKPIGPQPGLDPKLSAIRLMQIYDGKRIYVFDIRSIPLQIFDAFLRESTFIAHNGVFEIKHLEHNGFRDVKVNCSMLMARLVDGAEHSPFEPTDDEEDDPDEIAIENKKVRKGFGLEACIARLFDIKLEKSFQKSNWNAPKLTRDQINYAGLDAYLTFHVGKVLYPELKRYKMVGIYNLQRDMQHVIAEMENTGFAIDVKAHRKLIKEWKHEHEQARQRCGFFFGRFDARGRRTGDVNLNSSKQLCAWLEERFKDKAAVLRNWPKTKGGKKPNKKGIIKAPSYTFNRQALIGAGIKDKAIDAYLAFKKIDKLLNTYGETLLKTVHPLTGRIHCSFSLGETRTGRLSSRSPNLQNLPRGGTVREIFIPSNEQRLVVADYSQIEMRLMGEVSNDPFIRHAFEKGIDLHKVIVQDVIGVPYKKVTKEQRQIGKAINFGFAFGMGAPKCQIYARVNYGVELSEAQSEHGKDVFHNKRYKTYSLWCKRQRDNCERTTVVRTPLGRVRKLEPDEVYTKAVNTPVQGGAAEVMFKAMIFCRQRLERAGLAFCKLVLSVHDEIIIDSPTHVVAFAITILRKSMQDAMHEIFPLAPLRDLADDIGQGNNWFEAKEAA